jgi:predicted ATPase/class 3 adenylate cyclase/Tfp pilus assembly protein PilF
MDTTSLPEGTVTFLFTDIEGSTRLLQHLGDRYADLLAEHRRLLRAAFSAHQGHELGTEGDSFFVVFSRASDALHAVIDAQRALAAHPWPEGAPVRVRMGLHTGEPILTPEGYVGLDVHRAARVNGCGYGGQILLSQGTRDLLGHELPSGVTLRDMGEHRLKDLLHPEHLFQVVIEGLPADFPALKSLSIKPNNLPLQLSSFIGREQEMAEVKRLLGATRLLTLTGTGGAGKTRLALQVTADLLEEYAEGVWLVELAALTEGNLLPQAVADALHMREEPNRPLMATLVEHLRPRRVLLLLDNCEHLVEACARLAEGLLQSCPKLKILATSREPLGIAGELTWRVPSLPVPDPERLPRGETERLAAIAPYEGVRLFLERAFFHQPRFTVTEGNAAAVAEVCHRLDGIPLAIELAAARVKALPVEKIAERLDDRFRLLTGGSRTTLPRQQTLQALIDWSYDLLSAAERALLLRLSVFAGGWTLEAAEFVCTGEDEKGTLVAGGPPETEAPGDGSRPPIGSGPSAEAWEVLDLLTSLVEKSLVQYEEREGDGRYRLLETIRQYANEKLRCSVEAEPVRQRHHDYYLQLAEEAEPHLQGPEQAAWLRRLEREHDNLRAALDGSLASGHAEAGLRLAAALWPFWRIRVHWAEGRERLAALLALPETGEPTAVWARVLRGAGVLAYLQADFAAARSFFEQSRDLSQALGDRSGVAAAINNLGNVACEYGEYSTARSLFEESLAIRRELEDPVGIASCLNNLGNVALELGDYPAARAFQEQSLEIQRRIGDPYDIALSLNNLGLVASDLGDYDTAQALLEESLELRRQLEDKAGITAVLNNLGNIALDRGDPATARALHEQSLAMRRESSDKLGVAVSLYNLGGVVLRQKEYAAARTFFEESLALARELGQRVHEADALRRLGDAFRLEGEHGNARALYVQSLTIWRELDDPGGIAATLEAAAKLAEGEGRPEQSARLCGAASCLRETHQAPLKLTARAEYDTCVSAARAALGEDAFAGAWAEGQAMSIEEVIRYALAGLGHG